MEGDTKTLFLSFMYVSFQSTPSAWRATYLSAIQHRNTAKFQSTPSAWRATIMIRQLLPCTEHFNPRPPHGGRLDVTLSGSSKPRFQSTPSAWRATPEINFEVLDSTISIHALRMEGDTRRGGRGANGWYFNPRPPHGGRLYLIFSITFP